MLDRWPETKPSPEAPATVPTSPTALAPQLPSATLPLRTARTASAVPRGGARDRAVSQIAPETEIGGPAAGRSGDPSLDTARPAADRSTGAPDPGPDVGGGGGGSRLRGSGWLFLRGGGGAIAALAPQGRIGGGQAGVRLIRTIGGGGGGVGDGIAASARLSRAIDGPRQTEAALGLDVQPLATPLLHVTIERRIAIDRGGRDAWAAGVAGGVYALRLVPHTRIDGYGQAGIVGARRRDLYADGAVRGGAELAIAPRASLTIGGGVWGAAQPGAARLDVGPSAVVRVPVGPVSLAAAIDYRGRIAGDARPGSGPALTIGIDF